MVRRASVAACLTAALVLAFGAALPTAAPDPAGPASRLPRRQGRLQLPWRHLDGERGWLERPSPDRQPRSRGVSAVLARRAVDRVLVEPLRQQRRLRHPVAGGAPRRLTYHTGSDDVVGWTRDSAQVIFRAASGRGRLSVRRHALPDRREGRPGAVAESRLGLLGQLLTGRQVARLQPPSGHLVPAPLSRQLRRRPLDRRRRREELHEAARRRAVQPLLADVGRRRLDLLRRRSAAEREGRAARAASRCGRASTTSTRFRSRADSRRR